MISAKRNNLISFSKNPLTLFVIGFFVCAIFFGFSQNIQAQENSGESIQNFKSSITVNTESTISITETIVYDFGANERHGIFRDIPIKYKAKWGNISITLSDVAVFDERGTPYIFTTSYNGNDFRIKIGDPNFTIKGLHTYSVMYKVSRAIGYFEDFDEIYWNVTGNGWQIPIHSVQAEVFLPTSFNINELSSACYEGGYGSKESCALSKPEGSSNTLYFSTTRPLSAYEGLTIAVGFPKGVVAETSKKELAASYIKDNIFTVFILLIPVIVFLFLLRRWYLYGRDPKNNRTIIPQYDVPNNLSPAGVALIVNQSIRSNDISAEIINLSVKGHMKIENLSGTDDGLVRDEDYRFTGIPGAPLMDESAERDLLVGILQTDNFTTKDGSLVSTKLSKIEKRFPYTAEKFRKAKIKDLIREGYFQEDPGKVFTKYFSTGIAVLFFGFFFGFGYWPLTVAIMLSAATYLGFSFIMPVRTVKGVETQQYLLGLKEYLQIAEKDRINFHNAPEKKPELFEKLLPYAMVLGVEKAWAKEFESLYQSPPNWYQDSSITSFNTNSFIQSMSHFNIVSRSAFTPQVRSTNNSSSGSSFGSGSGSGGGGFSGGGGGGGGGGSW